MDMSSEFFSQAHVSFINFNILTRFSPIRLQNEMSQLLTKICFFFTVLPMTLACLFVDGIESKLVKFGHK